MRKKLLVIVGSLAAIFVGLAVTFYFLTVAGAQRPEAGPDLGGRFFKVMDGFAAVYFIDLGNGKLAMIDAGNDRRGRLITETLKAKNKTPDDVEAVFITHAHPDHVAALGLFPQAVVYVGKPEAPIAEGKEPFRSPITRLLGKWVKPPIKVGHALADGEKTELGQVTVQSFVIPGHTAGSTAYLIDGALFLGDSANFRSDGSLGGAWWLASDDKDLAKQSLKNLVSRLSPDSVKFTVTAHTGVGVGMEALKTFAGF